MTVATAEPSDLSLRDSCASRPALHVDHAAEIVTRFAHPISAAEMLPIARATGRVLKSDVVSPIPLPRFDHSAVDGYGISSESVAAPQTTLPVTARILAGEAKSVRIAGSAVRVMTGAPVPAGCDAVVMQEHVLRSDAGITVTDSVRSGANIRRAGEDVAPGDRIVRAGTVLDARHIALLTGCGVARVPVARRVRVAIAAFGNELRRPGTRLQEAQIYDSNSAMAAAFLARPCCRLVKSVRAGDEHHRAVALFGELAASADLIVTSGGMSHGDEDHTRSALEDAGGFWDEVGFAMRPGKPARLGRIGEAVVLGLPGNPFAALVALLVLGLPILNALTTGHRAPKWLPATADFTLERASGRTEFFPARVHAADAAAPLRVERLGKGGSARLHPLVHADGLGRIDAAEGSVAPGDGLLFLPFSAMLS